LIINERLEEYDGTTAVVRTEHLSADEVEFRRWRAERWMKMRHMPAAFARSPLFLLRNAPKMCSRTPFSEARSAHSSGSKTSAMPPALPGHPARRARRRVTFLATFGRSRRVQQ
jgi:hypothetical protein